MRIISTMMTKKKPQDRVVGGQQQQQKEEGDCKRERGIKKEHTRKLELLESLRTESNFRWPRSTKIRLFPSFISLPKECRPCVDLLVHIKCSMKEDGRAAHSPP